MAVYLHYMVWRIAVEYMAQERLMGRVVVGQRGGVIINPRQPRYTALIRCHCLTPYDQSLWYVTIVASDESVTISVCDRSVHVLLRLLKRDIHVSVQA